MKAGRSLLVVFLLCAAVAAGALSYQHWSGLTERFTQRTANVSNPESLSLPPFSTKEPERYQATRIISSVANKDELLTIISKTLIARDGDKRREEYEPGTNETVVYLEIPEGRFLLSPAKKLYAGLDLAPGNLDAFKSDDNSDVSSAPPVTPDLSPERLLHDTPAPARYEKLGSETINERAATRYRVTAKDATNGSSAGSVTLIWIDDALGLPIRSETSSTTREHPATLTVELRDLKDIVDPRIFELPRDYEKVDYRRFFAEMPPTPGVPGRERHAPEKP